MSPRLASLVLLTAASANALAAPSTMSKRAGPRLDLALQSDAPDAKRTCGPPIFLNMVSGEEYEPAIQAAIDAALDDETRFFGTLPEYELGDVRDWKEEQKYIVLREARTSFGTSDGHEITFEVFYGDMDETKKRAALLDAYEQS